MTVQTAKKGGRKWKYDGRDFTHDLNQFVCRAQSITIFAMGFQKNSRLEISNWTRVAKIEHFQKCHHNETKWIVTICWKKIQFNKKIRIFLKDEIEKRRNRGTGNKCKNNENHSKRMSDYMHYWNWIQIDKEMCFRSTQLNFCFFSILSFFLSGNKLNRHQIFTVQLCVGI